MSTEIERVVGTIGPEVTLTEEVPMVRQERWEEMRRLWRQERVPIAELARRFELDPAYHVLVRQTPYHELGADYFDRPAGPPLRAAGRRRSLRPGATPRYARPSMATPGPVAPGCDGPPGRRVRPGRPPGQKRAYVQACVPVSTAPTRCHLCWRGCCSLAA
jgi:hypothetical protein